MKLDRRNMKIFVLNNYPENSSTKRLVSTGEKRGHQVEVVPYNDLYLHLSDSPNGHDKIYQKGTKLDVKSCDAVIPRMGNNLNYGLYVLEHFVGNMKVPSTSSPDGLATAANKFLTSQKLSQEKVRIPKTIFAYKPESVDFLIDKVGGLPCIAKTVLGSQGVGVMILETKLAANTTLETLFKNDIEINLQQFLEANGKDIRVIVVDNEVVVAMERTSNKGDFRANLSKGGAGRKIDLTQDEKEMAVKAAQAVGLGDFAGVDLIRAKEHTYCIEVNGNPGDGIIEITGVNYYENLYKMLENRHNNNNKKQQKAYTTTTENSMELPKKLGEYALYGSVERHRLKYGEYRNVQPYLKITDSYTLAGYNHNLQWLYVDVENGKQYYLVNGELVY